MRLIVLLATTLLCALAWLAPWRASAVENPVLEGPTAFGDWRADAPGLRRHISVGDLPPPNATPPAGNPPRITRKPPTAQLKVPPGFRIGLYASGLEGPRAIRVAPNGDVFVSETRSGRVIALRALDGAARPSDQQIFASGLNRPFGLAFYPPGPNPQWLYVANTDSVVRFAYRAGDLIAREASRVIVPELPHGVGHSTRDIVFSIDGQQMFVSVGSASNNGENMLPHAPADLQRWDAQHGLGAAWGPEADRADVLVFSPEGNRRRIFASGIRNCVGLAVDPAGSSLWCSTNERDGLGDDLVPDYITRVREGAFYGWPWYYLGSHQDPAHPGKRPDLKDKVTVPDVLIEAHSASLQMTFYDGTQFPRDYRGSAFAAEHGSWNRAKRTGYKVIRVIMKDGIPSGEYEDFVTGFVVNDASVWGRPVGVGVAHDGSLLISEDAGGTLWRVSYGERDE
jgi:glucose/arabinose dehydrogenase